MNYRHAYHAGNFADVVKHMALVAALTYLKKKDTPFAVIDTHAGRGLYDLESLEATKTGEAESGIRRLTGIADGTLGNYLKLARAFGKERYPGSPLIAALMLRPQDRLVAIEKHEEEVRALKRALTPYSRARAIDGDGYERLIALLPPPERRGLVLIDPPFESTDEFTRMAATFGNAYRRFATGIYMLWFPVKSKSSADAFCAEAVGCGITRALRIDVDIGEGRDDKLHAAGLLLVNPPFGFATEMRAVLDSIAPALGKMDHPAKTRIDWLAGAE